MSHCPARTARSGPRTLYSRWAYGREGNAPTTYHTRPLSPICRLVAKPGACGASHPLVCSSPESEPGGQTVPRQPPNDFDDQSHVADPPPSTPGRRRVPDYILVCPKPQDDNSGRKKNLKSCSRLPLSLHPRSKLCQHRSVIPDRT